jgi:guanine nucleotide-binding protein G(i) subunit alpha
MGNCGPQMKPSTKTANNDAKDTKSSKNKKNSSDEINPKYYLKLLMIGTTASGKSTFAKQMKILHMNGFSDSEKEDFKRILAWNLMLAVNELLEQAKKLGRLENSALLDKYKPHETQLTSEIAQELTRLWKDKTIQEVYATAQKHLTLTNVPYYFEHAEQWADPNYTLTNEDILHARQRTSGFVEHKFKVGKYTWNLVDAGGQRAERRKWVKYYEGIVAVIFVASLDDWDIPCPEEPNKTRLQESLEVFESMINHEWFSQLPWILFLNKSDLFAEKLKKVNLSETFKEYKGGDDFDKGVEFIRELYMSKVKNKTPIYVHTTCALDTNKVKTVFEDVQDFVFRQRLSAGGFAF